MYMPKIQRLDLRPGFQAVNIEIARRPLPQRALDAVRDFFRQLKL